MESSEVRARSLITSVVLFGAGTLVGAGATWLIMSVAGSDRRGSPRGSTTSPVVAPKDGSGSVQTKTSRQRCSDQLRSILADLEVRLVDAIDELVAQFSMSRRDGDQTSKTSRKPSASEVTPSKSQCVHFLL